MGSPLIDTIGPNLQSFLETDKNFFAVARAVSKLWHERRRDGSTAYSVGSLLTSPFTGEVIVHVYCRVRPNSV